MILLNNVGLNDGELSIVTLKLGLGISIVHSYVQ